MSGKIMVLFDCLSIREEPVQYSIELAKRMDCSLSVLVLLSLDSEEVLEADDLETRADRALQGALDSARRAGVEVEAEVRAGSPSSELMKFLAGARSVRTVVWGGAPSCGDPMPDKSHWLSRMKDMLSCPVVVPSRK